MAMIQCDYCGKKMSVKSLNIQEREEGELRIQFFRCNGCGKEYLGAVTDEALRQEIQEIKLEQAKTKVMIQKKFREETIEKAKKELEQRRLDAVKRMEEIKAEYQRGENHGEKTGGTDAPVGI